MEYRRAGSSPCKVGLDQKLRLSLAPPLKELAHTQRSNMPISGTSTAGRSTAEFVRSRVASLLRSSYSARSTLPPSVLSHNAPDDMTDITSGPLSGKGYRQRQWRDCSYLYEFGNPLGDTQMGCLDYLNFHMTLTSAALNQRITLKWDSTLLLPSGSQPDEHKIVIDVDVPVKKHEKSPATMYIFGSRKVIEEDEAARKLWKRIESLCSPFQITRNYSSRGGADGSFAGKVGHMNGAMADECFVELVRRFPGAQQDQLLISVKDEINGLLRGYLSTVWRRSADGQ